MHLLFETEYCLKSGNGLKTGNPERPQSLPALAVPKSGVSPLETHTSHTPSLCPL